MFWWGGNILIKFLRLLEFKWFWVGKWIKLCKKKWGDFGNKFFGVNYFFVILEIFLLIILV